jgi:hypothetical protein
LKEKEKEQFFQIGLMMAVLEGAFIFRWTTTGWRRITEREREAAKVGRDVNVVEGPAMKMVVRSPSPFSSFQVIGH